MQPLSAIFSPSQIVLFWTLLVSIAVSISARFLSRRVFGRDSLVATVAYRLVLFGALLSVSAAILGTFGIDVRALANDIGNAPLFTISNQEITAVTVVVFIILLVATWYGSIFVREATIRGLSARAIGDGGTILSVSRLVQYAVGFLGVAVSLEAIGIDLGALITAGAVFAVGIGFAMQNIAQNFVSGVILLAERSISPGDIVVVDGQMVRVKELGIRSTLARTLDDEEIIIPNSFLVQSNVKNLTLTDDSMRVRLVVGVAYESDLELVFSALREAADTVPTRCFQSKPVVVLTDFGASSVDFEVSVWTPDPWQIQAVRSDLALAVWNGLKTAQVCISFPQLDVHFDAGVLPPATTAAEA